jgi:hypothetical protein
MLCKPFWLTLLSLPLLCLTALADGKVFTTAVAAPVTTPDQRAMLQFSNGVERLVIETSFVGQGTNFAWVVPLPSAPKVEAVSTNFFGYLNASFQPHLITEAAPWWGLFLWIGFIVSSGIVFTRLKGPNRLLRWFAINFAFFFFVLFLPASASLGVKARSLSIGGPENSVQVLNRQSVGIYTTATITGNNAAALLDWMNGHGFQTPASALPAVSNYAARGWVFVAATINREISPKNGSRPHPLAFTFSSEKPVYPLQLTGVENPRCAIELYVFGPNRADAPGFRVEYCGQPSVLNFPDKDYPGEHRELFRPSPPGEFKFVNSEIFRFAFPAAVTTKLVGTLSAKQMESDAWINWMPFQSAVPSYHAPEAVRGEIYNWLAGIGVPGVLLFQIYFIGSRKKLLLPGVMILLLIECVCGVVRYATIEKVKVTYHRGGLIVTIHEFKEIDACLNMFAQDYKTNSVSLTESNFLPEFKKFCNEWEFGWRGGPKNPFADEPIRIEPTPGNMTLQHVTNGLEVFWHDYYGGPHKLATFPSKQ